jgi:DNA-directed RNA polymerase subunit RPC12/RpoP
MNQFPGPWHALSSSMASVLYRCATTGMNVQAWFADNVSDDNLYVSLRCPACARIHLVNRAGRTLLPPMP